MNIVDIFRAEVLYLPTNIIQSENNCLHYKPVTNNRCYNFFVHPELT